MADTSACGKLFPQRQESHERQSRSFAAQVMGWDRLRQHGGRVGTGYSKLLTNQKPNSNKPGILIACVAIVYNHDIHSSLCESIQGP